MTDPWLRDVPAVFRALADPRLESAIPQPTTGPLEQACAHWGALHYTLSSLLGWADIGRGLAWWYAAGKPVDDSPVLALVQRVWGADDLIDYYAAWAWLPEGVGYEFPQSVSPFDGPSPTWLGRHSRWKNEEWWRGFARRGQVHHYDPFYGGSDPLHLAAHAGRPRSSRRRTRWTPGPASAPRRAGHGGAGPLAGRPACTGSKFATAGRAIVAGGDLRSSRRLSV